MSLFLISLTSAFQLEKKLVQIEVDENYPCHIENNNEIVCNPITNQQINDWKDKIDNLPLEEKDKGRKTDKQKKDLLNEGVIPYKKGKYEKVVDVKKVYREKIDINSLGDNLIEIGFGTNVFGVSGTPLENFDVDESAGIVTYRPLNRTWLNLDGSASYVTLNNNFASELTENSNLTVSIWFNNTETDGTSDAFIVLRGSSNPYGMISLSLDGDEGGRVQLVYTAENATANIAINESFTLHNWHNLIFTKQATNYSIYIDGQYQTNNISYSSVSSIPPASQISLTSIGFEGGVDEFRIFNTSLNLSEINSIYNANRNRTINMLETQNDNNQIKYLPMNEGKDAIVYDLSNKGFNGTITGATWQNDGINVTTLGYPVNISIVNMSNAYIRWDNGTVLNSYYTGNQTYSFLNNQTLYITDDYYSGSEVTQIGLWSYLRLNENTGTTAYDVSGNGNNGTITGATWADDAVDNTLTKDVDYTLSTDQFTIVNDEHAWKQVVTDYDYKVTETYGFHISIIRLITGFVALFALIAVIVLVMNFLNKIRTD